MKIFFIINAGRRRRGPDRALLEQMCRTFAHRGIACRMELSNSVGQCHEMLRRAGREGYNSLWIGGGDGTINHIINSAAGQFDTYAVVPMGTVNGMARALGVPRHPVEAVEWLLEGAPTALDLGRVGSRYFTLYATVGFHAAIFHGTNQALKRAVGRAAFFAAGAVEACRTSLLPRFEVEMTTVTPADSPCSLPPVAAGPGCRESAPAPAEPRLTADHTPLPQELQRETRSGYTLVLSNFCNYAGFGAVREGELCDSSFLQAHLFESCSLWPMLRYFAAMRLRQAAPETPDVEQFRVSELEVRSDRPLYLQVDGEPIHIGNDEHFRFHCMPKAIQVLWNRERVLAARSAPSEEQASAPAEEGGSGQ